MIKPSDMDNIILASRFRKSNNQHKFDYNEIYQLLYNDDKQKYIDLYEDLWSDDFENDYNKELDYIVKPRKPEMWEYKYYKFCYQFYNWLIKEPKRHIFRSIKTRFDNDDMLNYITTKAKKVGVCWAFDIEHAISYFAENDDITNDYILEAEIDVFKNVDINYTIYANAVSIMEYEGEYECRLIENTPIKIINIYKMYDKESKKIKIRSFSDSDRYNIVRDKINNKELNITVKA